MLLTDPRVAAVAVRECEEPLVDVLDGADERLRLDPREQNPTGAYRLLRTGVVDALSRAAATLPRTIGLLIVEGWRDPADQEHRFNAYRRRLRDEQPALSEVELRNQAAAFVSPVEVAPHCTGGAVDLTLMDLQTGAELDLGGVVNAHRFGDTTSCAFAAPEVSPQARARRGLLATAMHTAGFVNYPSEWWHWSTGERYWAITAGAPAAIYGPAPSSELPRQRAVPHGRRTGEPGEAPRPRHI